MMTTETATVVINGVEYELPTQFEFTVCQGITVTLHRPAVREVEGTIEEQEKGTAGESYLSPRKPLCQCPREA